MKIPINENKFLSQWNNYEVARYVKSLNRVIRDKVDSNPLILKSNQLSDYALKYSNIGIYTSVFAYNSTDIDSATRLGPLYFDIDSSSLEEAHSDCMKLYEHLASILPEECILVYFTGKKGFHIECEPVALGINPSNSLPKVYRFIANDLKEKLSLNNLDFSVYDLRRMWRYPGSIHQDTGMYKTLLNPNNDSSILFSGKNNIVKYSKYPQSLEVKEQEFNYKANEWYRQYSYDMEESEKRRQNPLDYFNKYGSKAFKELSKTHKVFDPKSLLKECSAVSRLYKQAKGDGYLEHEARLFLCSILTYTEDSIKFLHEILSHCHDYNFDKSSAHINDWIKRREMGIGGRPYTCDRANSVGVGCGDCALDQRNKWVKIGDRYVETQEKTSPSPIRFAYKNIKEEEE
jgi:hypothetical protein